ncbi:MAG: ABC transporter ATP-binding protein [Velocimicrobium sp.]
MAKMLELNKITKSYGGFFANKDITLNINKGEVYCLLGENGAGKSTLMNVIYGLTKPDYGEIKMDGNVINITSPKDAIAYGIGMVHQHFMLIPALSVVENIILAMDDKKRVFIDKKAVAERIGTICGRYGFKIDPYKKVSELTVGQQQKVEIVKAIYHECNLLILDEPTAVLTPIETEELYVIIEQLKTENKSVIFISHKLHEVMKVSDKITVLRNGENVATLNKEETNEDELAAFMVGKPVCFVVEKQAASYGDCVLAVEELCVKGKKGNDIVNHLNLEVRAGEIYGVAGVDGNGQSELIEAITGLTRVESGVVNIRCKDMTNKEPRAVLNCGVSHIPEDRQNVGIFLKKSLMKNLIFYDYNKSEYKRGIFIDWKKEEKHAADIVEKYNIKTPGLYIPIGYLSGGNQQKAVVGRELEKKPNLLLAVHPTRGVDIGAIEFIHKEIIKARDNGCAVLLVSTELDEILALSDTIGVIYEGKILGKMKREDATVEKIGMYMAGVEEND